MDEMDEMDEIIQEFLVESHENLDQLDRDLVALEQQPGSRELLSNIFRTIHTIKGTSGFLAFSSLERLTHAGESLLARLRDGTQSLTPQSADALLRMVDTVRELLASIEATSGEGDIDSDAVIATVTACIGGGAGGGTAHPAPPARRAETAVAQAPAEAASAEPGSAEPVTDSEPPAVAGWTGC